MSQRIILLTAVLAAALAVPRGAWADVLILQNGGRLEGEVLNAETSPHRPSASNARARASGFESAAIR